MEQSTAELVKPQELQEIQENVSIIVSKTSSVVILNSDDEKAAIDLGKDLSDRAKRIEAIEKSITDPANQTLKSTRAFFAPFKADCANAIALLKGKILDFRAVQARKVAEEEAKIQKKVEQGKMKFSTAEKKLEKIEQPKQTVTAEKGAATSKKVPKYEVVDVTKLPVEYIQPNAGAIWNAVRAGVKEIPGVRIWEEDSLMIR